MSLLRYYELTCFRKKYVIIINLWVVHAHKVCLFFLQALYHILLYYRGLFIKLNDKLLHLELSTNWDLYFT